MTATTRDANTEPKTDLNIDIWSQTCAPATAGQAKGQAEIAHYRGAVEHAAAKTLAFCARL
jgi:hypothetical protein